jgi:hypothetical protein
VDRISFLRSQYRKRWPEQVAARLAQAYRPSSLRQQQVAWTALQEWLRVSGKEVSDGSLLEFLCSLRDQKNLSTNTILNYKASLTLPLSFVPELNLKAWQFQELSKALFLGKPPNQKRVPEWDVSKVLEMLGTKVEYVGQHIPLFHILKKTVFLLALATGNRVSEISAIDRSGIKFDQGSGRATLLVRPGFLYKNQRLGKSPPNICVGPLEDNSTLCPVTILKRYLQVTQLKTGPLFLNSKTSRPLHPSTLSRLLGEVINEADPGKFPRGHDVRKVASSIAWTRGLPPAEIVDRMFWSSSSPFVKYYLCPISNTPNCVAVGTEA